MKSSLELGLDHDLEFIFSLDLLTDLPPFCPMDGSALAARMTTMIPIRNQFSLIFSSNPILVLFLGTPVCKFTSALTSVHCTCQLPAWLCTIRIHIDSFIGNIHVAPVCTKLFTCMPNHTL